MKTSWNHIKHRKKQFLQLRSDYPMQCSKEGLLFYEIPATTLCIMHFNSLQCKEVVVQIWHLWIKNDWWESHNSEDERTRITRVDNIPLGNIKYATWNEFLVEFALHLLKIILQTGSSVATYLLNQEWGQDKMWSSYANVIYTQQYFQGDTTKNMLSYFNRGEPLSLSF